MISIEHRMTGNDLVQGIIDDPEEAIFFFEGLADEGGDRFLEEIQELVAGQTAEKIVEFARKLADAIENRP